MNTFIASFLSFIVKISANIENDLIFDYFNYKMAPSVVGFTCNMVNGMLLNKLEQSPLNFKFIQILRILTDDVILMKKFNKYDVTASLNNLNEEYKIHRFAWTHYWKLGVFLDVRCYETDYVMSIFSEVGYWIDYHLF